MKVIQSVIDANTTFTTTLPTTFPPFDGAYSYGATYARGFKVATGGTADTYLSLVDGNNSYPPTNPDKWKYLGRRSNPYASGTTYNTNGVATYKNRLWLSLQDANTGNSPDANPTWWQDDGPSNAFAMFDTMRTTETLSTVSPTEFVIAPGQRCDTLALLDMLADSVRVRVVDDYSLVTYDGSGLAVIPAGHTMYDTTITLLNHPCVDWFGYFFNSFQQTNDYLFENLPQYGTAGIVITFAKVVDYIACGLATLGKAVTIGVIQYGAEDDATNYSSITRDDFGTATLIPRRSVPKTSQTVWADKANTPVLRALRDSLNAVPAVWSGLDDATDAYFPSLLINGIYRTFTINIAYTDKTVVTLELEEV